MPAASEGSSQKFSLEDRALAQQLLGPAESQSKVCSNGWEHLWGSTQKGWAVGTEKMQDILTEVENWHEENQMTATRNKASNGLL